LLQSLRIAATAVAALTVAVTSGGQGHSHQVVHKHTAARVLAVQPLGYKIVREPFEFVQRKQTDRLLLAIDQAEAKKAAQAAAAAAAAAAPKAAPPAPASYGTGPVQDIITKAFAPYGPTAVAWGLRVAHCESGFNPRSYNPAGPYYGLFQFAMSTFKNTPYGSGDIYDPVANANAAAWKYANGGASAWGCR
jgi:hypothetical protein